MLRRSPGKRRKLRKEPEVQDRQGFTEKIILALISKMSKQGTILQAGVLIWTCRELASFSRWGALILALYFATQNLLF